MQLFTIQIELYAAAKEDRETLHAAMRNENFTNTIKDNKGTSFILPETAYNKTGEYTKEQVLDSAIRAAGKTGKQYTILVTESNGRCWSNLIQVK